MAKAAFWLIPDAEARKRGEQTGLDTLVVHAVNDECQRAAFATGVPPNIYEFHLYTRNSTHLSRTPD